MLEEKLANSMRLSTAVRTAYVSPGPVTRANEKVPSLTAYERVEKRSITNLMQTF